MRFTRERTRPDPDKFPVTQLFLLGETSRTPGIKDIHLLTVCLALIRVSEPIAITSIFPYAFRLVLDFDIGDRSNASFYAGILIAAFSLAEACTGV